MPARLVRDPHGRVGRVDRLPAGAGAAVDVDLQVVGVDLDLDVLGLGQHRDGRGRGVDPALGLGLGHALDAVRAALELEHRVRAVALDGERVRAVADRQRLDREAAPLGVAGQHPVQVAGPQPGLVAAGARADLDDHVLVVVGVALDHRQADLLLERLDPLARGLQQRPQLGVVAVLGEQLARALEVVDDAPVLGGQLGGRLELAVGPAGGREPLAVGDHLGVGQLALELAEARLDLGDELVDHASECRPAISLTEPRAQADDFDADHVLGRRPPRGLDREHRLQRGDRRPRAGRGRARAWSASAAAAPDT